MATLTITFLLEVEQSGERTERIEPPRNAGTVGGLHTRHVAELEADTFATLDAGNIDPGWWFMRNIDDTSDVVVSFGVTDDITLKPGRFAFFWSNQIPLAKGVGAAARLAYTVGEE